jgi:hypothetical protein
MMRIKTFEVQIRGPRFNTNPRIQETNTFCFLATFYESRNPIAKTVTVSGQRSFQLWLLKQEDEKQLYGFLLLVTNYTETPNRLSFHFLR